MAFILGECIINENDVLLPRTVADQVAISTSKNLTQKLNEIDTNVKSVADEVTSARNTFPNLKERIDSIELTSTTANNTANNVKAEVEGARGGQPTLNDRLGNMANDITQAQQTATTANDTANDIKQEIDNAKAPSGTLKEKIDGIDSKFRRYLPLTGGTLTGHLGGTTATMTGKITGLELDLGNINTDTFYPVFFRRNGFGTKIGASYSIPAGVQEKAMAIEVGDVVGGNYTMNVRYLFGETTFCPDQNNTLNLGGANTRWKSAHITDVHSINGTFAGNVSANGALQCNTIRPASNNTGNIGEDGKRFSTGDIGTLYTDRVDTRSGDLKLRAQGGGANIVVESTFIPDSDGQKYLGTSVRKWNSVWATNGTIQTSDERYKGDIQDIDDELFFEMVKGVNVNTYVMLNERKDEMTKKELNSKENKQANAKPERVQVGIIAQDMAQFDCSKYILVHDEESDIYSINNYNFTSALMAALKVEIAKREELEKRVEALENLIAQAQ